MTTEEMIEQSSHEKLQSCEDAPAVEPLAELINFAKNIYKQALLDAAESLEENGWPAGRSPSHAIREMAKEVE